MPETTPRHHKAEGLPSAAALICLALLAGPPSAVAQGGPATRPASVRQCYPPVNEDGSVDWDAENPYADDPESDEAMMVFHVKPPASSENGIITVTTVCDVHFEVLDSEGNPDPKKKPDSNEHRMKEKKPKKRGAKAADDRWDTKRGAGSITYYSDCSDPMPENGFHFVLWGGSGTKKNKDIQDYKITLTNDGQPPGAGNVVTTVTTSTNGRNLRGPVVAASIKSGGPNVGEHPHDGGYVCAIGTTGIFSLESDLEDAVALYEVRTSLSRDDDRDDPSLYGIDADTNPVPGAWGLGWTDLIGVLDGQAEATFELIVPNDPDLALETFWISGCTRPTEPADQGNITLQTPVTIVFSLDDYDGDTILNEVDPTPFGEEE